MSPRDEWEQIERLYHEALELPPGHRKSFLEHVPSQQVRAEVESLLETDSTLGAFLDAPPARLAAHLLDHQPGALAAGERLRDYEIEALVSMGGMGEIYLARDTRSQKKIALKILRRHLIASQQAADRFKTEARAASTLRHPNIVTVHESGESPIGLFIAMEWVDGITWRERMKAGAVTLSDLVEWGAQAARGLDAAHCAGILHRDIKPENIMLASGGIVKILDFGLARLTGPARPEIASTGASGTISGTLSGTLPYMPPEILRGEPATTASDVFSLGAVLYELATGQHPFAGETPLDVFEAIECRDVAAPSTVRAGIPFEIDALLLRMLDRDPALRPPASETHHLLSKVSATT